MQGILALDSGLIISGFILESWAQLDSEGQSLLVDDITVPSRRLLIQLFSVTGRQRLEGTCIRNRGEAVI